MKFQKYEEKYEVIKTKYLYIESDKYPFNTVRIYSVGNGMFDVECHDMYGKYHDFKRGVNSFNAIKYFKQYTNKYVNKLE